MFKDHQNSLTKQLKVTLLITNSSLKSVSKIELWSLSIVSAFEEVINKL